jgi:bifunctional non-homologous end joining protein LigD
MRMAGVAHLVQGRSSRPPPAGLPMGNLAREGRSRHNLVACPDPPGRHGGRRGGASLSDRVRISHPDKVLFPDDGITKADLAAYYETVAPVMLPLISGRPVTMQRFPNGIGRGGFLQKQVADYFPDWIERVTAPNRRTRNATTREQVTYVVCRTADDLVYLANQACVTPHVWLSRVPDVYHPDQMVFDLDPASTDRSVLRLAASALQGLLDELGLPSFLKSSGSRGLHVVVPLVPTDETDEVKVFSVAVAEVLAARHPEELTTEARIADRHGRLYLDIGRNGYAQTMAAPYAVRALPGAPVSVPLDWSELDEFDPGRHTLRTIAERLARPDPWAGIDAAASGLDHARARLAELGGATPA